MNYINKLRKLGFKRCDPLWICKYSQYEDGIDGYYIESAFTIYNQTKTNDFSKTVKYLNRMECGTPSMGFDSSGKCKMQTYSLLIDKDIKIFITLVADKYWAFLKNDLIPDEPHKYDKKIISKKNVSILIDGEKIQPDFWRKVQDKLSVDVLRIIRLNFLFKN